MAKQILIVDDDALLRRSLGFTLEQAGYHASAAATAEDGLNLARRIRPDLVLLDVGLPGMDGLEMLRLLQQEVGAPVIVVTARRRELDEILGLELGADDYISKPFDPDVLLAHVKAVLRRSQRAPAGTAAAPRVIVAGDITIDPAAHTVTRRGRPVQMTRREFALLQVLAEAAGRVCSVDDLLAQVWGAEYAGEPQVVYVHVRWLREKLEDDPRRPARIVTVRGVGYKLLPREADP